jgi:hypothetical protein
MKRLRKITNNSVRITCNPLNTEFLLAVWKNSVRTLQETHIPATKTNQLMLFRETVVVYCENHTKCAKTLCGQNAVFQYVKAGGTCKTTGL